MTLLERFGCFGGNITAVGVEGFAWYRHDQTIDTEGVGREFEDRARIRADTTAAGVWPSDDGSNYVRQENKLLIPASFSPMH